MRSFTGAFLLSISLLMTVDAGATSPLQLAKFKSRLDAALKSFQAKDEELSLKMAIIEPDGQSKPPMELTVQRVGDGKEQRALLRMNMPKDLRGTAILSKVTRSNEDQWIYLPSTKQTRKIVAADQSETGILGSELRYEDFNPAVIRRSKVEFVATETRDTKSYDVFETKIPKGISPYQKARFWIDNAEDLPVQIDYFANNEKVKTVQFLGFKKIDSVLRPHKVVIKNLKNNRGTTLEMTSFKVNKGLAMEDLSVESLSKSW